MRAPWVEAAVQRTGEHAGVPQLLGHPVGAALGADEDHGPARAAGDLGRHRRLVLGRDVEQVVSHGRDAGLGGVDLVGDRVVRYC